MITYTADVMDDAGNTIQLVAYPDYADLIVERASKGVELHLSADDLENLSQAAATIASVMRSNDNN